MILMYFSASIQSVHLNSMVMRAKAIQDQMEDRCKARTSLALILEKPQGR